MAEWPVVLSDDVALNPLTRCCIACDSPIGDPHALTCSAVGRKVRIRYTFDVEVVVPCRMSDAEVLQRRKSHDWCGSAALREIAVGAAKTGCACALIDIESVETVSADPVQAPGTTAVVRAEHPYRRHHMPEGSELN